MATGPHQVWSWDITYLKTPVHGTFSYLYPILDVWSRKFVGWCVKTTESSAHAAAQFDATCAAAAIDPAGIVLHADNGGPMKGATMLARAGAPRGRAVLQAAGGDQRQPVLRGPVPDRHYRPEFPRDAIADLASTTAWVAAFVAWYNDEHQHSAIRFVTPAQRHAGSDLALLTQRSRVYAAAKAGHPERWSGAMRDWSPILTVRPNLLDGAARELRQ